MFETLSSRLESIFERLRGRGKITEADLTEVMREVRQALLEADVNLKLVKQFIAGVQEKALGADVLSGLNPSQQIISIVYDELVEMLGGVDAKPKITYAGAPPTILMLVGLQGSGKTTTCAKLALTLRKQGQKPGLVACDMQRPAAVTQLQQLGKQLNIPVYAEEMGAKPIDIAQRSLRWATAQGVTILIIDTAGRLHIDDALMGELQTMQSRTRPNETLLVVDSMTGQDAVRVAQSFHESVQLTGLILTKMDGDARGGAALSIRAMTGLPIKFIGMGEKVEAIDLFYADRLAQRILGMGDVLTLIEKAREHITEEDAQKMEKKLRTASFNLDDFLNNMRSVRKMGPLTQLMEMIPGLNKMVDSNQLQEMMKGDELKRVEAIICSMTMQERKNPDILNFSRKKRVAAGSGTTVQDINNLLRSFKEMQTYLRRAMNTQQPKKLAKPNKSLPQGKSHMHGKSAKSHKR